MPELAIYVLPRVSTTKVRLRAMRSNTETCKEKHGKRTDFARIDLVLLWSGR